MNFRNFLLSSLDDTDRKTLTPLLSEVSLARGDVIYPDGGEVTQVYFPSSAILSVVTVMRDGRWVESSSIGREGGTGLLEAATRVCSRPRVFTQIPGSALRLPADAYRRQLQASPAFSTLMLRYTVANAAQTQQFVACNVLHTAEQRLARWLLMTADRTGAPTFTLTQDYLAVMTGVQRTTISVLASDFKNRGLIQYSRGAIEIREPDRLRQVACECAKVAHEIFEGLRKEA